MPGTYTKLRRILPLTTLAAAVLLALPPAARAEHDRGQKGVTLYEDADFRGRSEFFTQDDPRLADNRIGNDRVSSIRVDRGCEVTLYENERYKGDSEVFEEDAYDLHDSRVGNDEASSLTVRCAGRGGNTDGSYGWGEGVTLYVDSDFRGRYQSFTRDVRDLRGTEIGNDKASSVRVARGCEAILYADTHFRGPSIEIDDDIENLSETRIGNDEVSSIEVRCRRRR